MLSGNVAYLADGIFDRTQTRGWWCVAVWLRAASLFFGRYNIWLRRGCMGVWPIRLWWLAGAALFLGGCAGGGNLEPAVSQVYRAYDARVSRELVAGHDDLRGSYVEVRFSPKKILTINDKSVRGATVGTLAGATRGPAPRTENSLGDGKAVVPRGRKGEGTNTDGQGLTRTD